MRRLKERIELRGIGLHSGKECKLTIEPYETSTVILSNGEEEASLRDLFCDGTRRGSDYIFPSGERIRTCEHIFSALCGLGIYSGIRISVDGGEMPALDGCALKISGEILKKSYEDDEPLRVCDILKPLMVKSEDGKRFVCAFPCEEFRITYTVEYPYIGVQTYDYTAGTDYVKEIAPARTFALKRDIENLRSNGMALGGTIENAIIIGEGGAEAYGGLRFEDEIVRHKVLDMMGDIYSIGEPIRAHIICMRGGHELHLRLAEKLKGELIDG